MRTPHLIYLNFRLDTSMVSTLQQSINQLEMVANPARGQLNKKNAFSLSARSSIWFSLLGQVAFSTKRYYVVAHLFPLESFHERCFWSKESAEIILLTAPVVPDPTNRTTSSSGSPSVCIIMPSCFITTKNENNVTGSLLVKYRVVIARKSFS